MLANSRHEVEEAWRERLLAAQERYRSASEAYRRIQIEFQARSMSSADSNYALQQALRAENEARAAYVRVLNTFARLILQGEPPDEKEPTA